MSNVTRREWKVVKTGTGVAQLGVGRSSQRDRV